MTTGAHPADDVAQGQSLPSHADIVVIGAGPAGTTVASLLKKYRPETSVVVLEQDTFPRPHIGESLLIDINRILHDMGAIEAIDAAGFSRKYGATFCWGPERSAWHLLWSHIDELAAIASYEVRYTWHVDRDRYDDILARHARSLGAVVLERHSVTSVVRDGDGVRGVVVRTPGGEVRSVASQFVVDASGGQGPLARDASGRELDRALLNIAVYGYFEGLRLPSEVFGSPEQPRTGILLHPLGWVWMIPLAGGRTSVGFVTSLETHRQLGIRDLKAYLLERLAEVPEWPTMSQSSALCDYHGDGRLVHAIQEYSYRVRNVAGDGWALCGDSAGFVDAILSVGCFLGHFHGQFLAYALASVLDGECSARLALESYGRVVQENVEGLRSISHMFYAYAHSQDQWWRGCSEIVRASPLVPTPNDTSAFLALVSGMSARNHLYEEALHLAGPSLLVDAGRHGFLSAGEGFPQPAIEARMHQLGKLLAQNPRLRWSGEPVAIASVLPHTGTGRIQQVTRLEYRLPGDDTNPPALSTLRRAYVSPKLEGFWLGLSDAVAFDSALQSYLAELPADQRDPLGREAWDTALDLLGVGALEITGEHP
jgi:flavin-dependent dehydrogenase